MPQNDTSTASGVTFSRFLLPIIALVLLILRWLLPASLIESVYSQGFYVALRWAYDNTIGRLPISLYYVFWLVVIWWLISFLIKSWRGRRSIKSWKKQGWKLLNAVALLIIIFLAGWGFNYGREEVAEYANFSYHEPSLEELRERVYTEAGALKLLRAKLTSDTTVLPESLFLESMLETQVRGALTQALRSLNYPIAGRPTVRQLYPKGILLTWSTAGVYWPWVGQGNIDAGLHYLQKPAVMAHEMTHAYGFGDEGTCTFFAWLAGQQDKHTTAPIIYAIRLSYWRRIAGKLRQLEPEAYWAWRAEALDPGIRNDLQAIYDNRALYSPIAPALRDATYNTYLRAQGIHEGMLNYGKVVKMVEGYRKSRSNH